MKRKIKQILPADGIYAVYAASETEISFERVICWALVDNAGESEVCGMFAKELVDFCEDRIHFDGYVHEADLSTEDSDAVEEGAAETKFNWQMKAVLAAISQLGTPTHAEIVELTGQDRSNCHRRLRKLISANKVIQLAEYPARFKLVKDE